MMITMIIINPKSYKVLPHMHPKNAEAMTIIKGLVDVVIFDNKGKVMMLVAINYYKQTMNNNMQGIRCNCNFVFFGVSVGSLVNNSSCYDSRHLNLTQHLGGSSLGKLSLSHILTEVFVGGIHLTC